MEENLRKAVAIGRGEYLEILSRPLTAMLLASAIIVLLMALLPSVRKKRETIFVE